MPQNEVFVGVHILFVVVLRKKKKQMRRLKEYIKIIFGKTKALFTNLNLSYVLE